MDSIHKKLLDLGVPAGILGFQHIHDALKLLTEDVVGGGTVMRYNIMSLYDRVAKMNGTTGSRVERAIRHAIEVAFDRMPANLQAEIFGASVHPGKGKPTNKEFLSLLALTIGEVA